MLKTTKVERTIARAIAALVFLGRSCRAGLGHLRRGRLP